MSINTHNFITPSRPSRRDDLESLSYILIDFYLGALPWDGLENPDFSIANEMVKKSKMQADFQNLPKEFIDFWKYARRISFTQAPDYQYWRQIFKKMATERNIEYDGKYDWVQG